MRGVSGPESLAAVWAQARAGRIAQRLQRQAGQDVLAQDFVQIDLVMFIDDGLIVGRTVRQFDRKTGANIGHGHELLVERAVYPSDCVLQATRALENHPRMKVAMREDTLRGPRKSRMTGDRPLQMQLVGGIRERLTEIKIPR